jgi:hypothetical protein
MLFAIEIARPLLRIPADNAKPAHQFCFAAARLDQQPEVEAY